MSPLEIKNAQKKNRKLGFIKSTTDKTKVKKNQWMSFLFSDGITQNVLHHENMPI